MVDATASWTGRIDARTLKHRTSACVAPSRTPALDLRWLPEPIPRAESLSQQAELLGDTIREALSGPCCGRLSDAELWVVRRLPSLVCTGLGRCQPAH